MKILLMLAVTTTVVLLFAHTAEGSCYGSLSKYYTKPGTCPTINCLISNCQYDCDCYGNQKCCNGCCAIPDNKPGKCPNIFCVRSDCNSDRDCSGAKKCCNGCCANPLTTKG